jgi:serine/threonine-protein kinase
VTTQSLEAGHVVGGRYRVDGTLGQGGMGAVYRAYDLSIRREVAVKVLAPALRGHRTPNLRMSREAFATARVAHPNCVTVLDCGELDDGSVFLAMELLSGHELAGEMRRGPIEWGRALAIAADILRGLAYAHSAGVIHRDIKPANVFMTRAGGTEVAKILDFGIAKLVGDARAEAGAETLTQEGLAIGSPVYMSPEQAIGNRLDARTDLYSLTVVLFEMLTGRAPFDDEDKIAVLRMHLTRRPPRLVDAAPTLTPPDGLEELIARGLAKNPAERIQSAGEYIDAIAAILERARRRPIATPAGGARKRWWIAGVTAAALAVMLVAASATGGSGSTEANAIAAKAPEPEPEPEPAPAPEPAAEPEPEPELVIDEAELAPDLARIIVLLEQRRHREADRLSKALVKRHPKKALAHLARGHVYLDRMWWSDGFDSYRRALALDPELRSDPRVIDNAIRGLSSRSKPWLAERFIRDHLRDLARDALEEAARSRSKNMSRRAKRLLASI